MHPTGPDGGFRMDAERNEEASRPIGSENLRAAGRRMPCMIM
jgi:hypothetical protein